MGEQELEEGYPTQGVVAYELLLTLLEYQLCSPVQWIATQESLHKRQNHGQSYVEMGPGNTLKAMMEKTLAQYPNDETKDVTCHTFTEILEAIEKVSGAEMDEAEDETNPLASPDRLQETAAATVDQPAQHASKDQQSELSKIRPSSPLQTYAQATTTADVPLAAIDAITFIVASGLRVPLHSVDKGQSVRFQAKGRSALQNEIIGNLDAEFGQLPDDVENIALADLGEMLQPAFSGKAGKFLSGLLAKKISAKLAASVTLSKIRSHLITAYGLQTGHQDSFLLTADFDGILARQSDSHESWQCIDKWADDYCKKHGISQPRKVADPEKLQNGVAGEKAPQVVMDGSVLSEFSHELTDLMEKHFGPREDVRATTHPDAGSQDADKPDETHLSEELGPDFIQGTRPIFKPELVHQYQSSWNWAVQDLYVTLSSIVSRSDSLDKADGYGAALLDKWVDEACVRLCARTTQRTTDCAKYLLDKWRQSAATEARTRCVRLLGRITQRNDEDDEAECFSFESRGDSQTKPTRCTIPRTVVGEDGNISFHEVSVEDTTTTFKSDKDTASASVVLGSSSSGPPEPDVQANATKSSALELPSVSLLTRAPGAVSWETNAELTAHLHEAEDLLITHGDCGWYGTVLVIGAGRHSIGFALVRRLLEAGCRVALCTNRPTVEVRKEVAQLYSEASRSGAKLVLLPFNQGSAKDIEDLVTYINDTLGWEIDHLVPFAAIPERGKTLEQLDSSSELAHRVMLTNTLRLMGSIAMSKQRRLVLNHSTQVLVPLSPNHGQFSNDGMYAESKLALEAILNKWGSEPWSNQLSICGVRIGWTRGTGLMAANDVLAEEVEKLGIRTFSAAEMATLLGLVMSPSLAEACTLQPILCDFTGGLLANSDLGGKTLEAMLASIREKSSVNKRLKEEAELERRLADGGNGRVEKLEAKEVRGRFHQVLPSLPEQRREAVGDANEALQGLHDLESMVVVAGFAELGPAGSSRTRWELEANDEFSLEGCIELAWMTGLIRYERNRAQGNGEDAGPGWVECETGAPVREAEVKDRFEHRIREATGIRILDPRDDGDDGGDVNIDPRLRNMLQEVSVAHDLAPFECSSEAAAALQARHGQDVEIISNDGSAAMVRVRRGASIFVPKAVNTDFFVGARMPVGWDAARYGIAPEVAAQADRPALYTLVCAVEALISAGMTEAYELYRHVHVSEVGNCIGSGAGGTPAIQLFHEQRLLGRDVRSDTLSEAFVGTAAAWVNMLVLSAAGPIKTGAGACATSLESLDTACELIQSGRSKLCLAGGYDVFTRPVYYEFGAMGALANAAGDERRGRAPHEMSRPFTSTRGGFVLGEGVGVQVVCSAALALDMGLPIYGVVALTHMAGDKLSRSVPAPGPGMLTAATQAVGSSPGSGLGPGAAVLLSPELRAKRLRKSLANMAKQAADDAADVRAEAVAAGCSAHEAEWRVQGVRDASRLEQRAVRRALGQRFFVGHPGISLIAGALAVYGLCVDDITFASLHGTATKLNDVNECATLHAQMRHLGRNPGNPLFTIAQKSVVGHGLGASGAWAINGALQAMHSGIIPGNRNADDVDKALAGFDSLLLANQTITIRPDQVKAFSVTSFGFGQKGAQTLVVHPRYLYAVISDGQYESYRAKQVLRGPRVSRGLDRGLHGYPLFRAKEDAPYGSDDQDSFLLDPLARIP